MLWGSGVSCPVVALSRRETCVPCCHGHWLLAALLGHTSGDQGTLRSNDIFHGQQNIMAGPGHL